MALASKRSGLGLDATETMFYVDFSRFD